jgi:hypothetical protein
MLVPETRPANWANRIEQLSRTGSVYQPIKPFRTKGEDFGKRKGPPAKTQALNLNIILNNFWVPEGLSGC